jgi:hypothetical protein
VLGSLLFGESLKGKMVPILCMVLGVVLIVLRELPSF